MEWHKITTYPGQIREISHSGRIYVLTDSAGDAFSFYKQLHPDIVIDRMIFPNIEPVEEDEAETLRNYSDPNRNVRLIARQGRSLMVLLFPTSDLDDNAQTTKRVFFESSGN